MELVKEVKEKAEKGAKAVSRFILKELEMPYAPQYAGKGCSRVNYCSCDCNYISCPVFMG